MEGLPLLKHAMKEKVLMITIDLKVLAFVCQWVNSINPFLGSFLFFNSLLSTFSPYFIHKATEQQSLMGGGGGGGGGGFFFFLIFFSLVRVFCFLFFFG